MTRIAHCCCGALTAEVTGEPSLVGAFIAWSASGVPARPSASAPISRRVRCASGGRARCMCAAATRGERSNFISAPTAAPRCSGTRNLPRTLSYSLWHVRRPVDAPADGIGVGDGAASVGDLRSSGRSVYRRPIDAGNTRNRLMRTPRSATISNRYAGDGVVAANGQNFGQAAMSRRPAAAPSYVRNMCKLGWHHRF